VNEIVAATKAWTTLEFSVTCKSTREGAMGDKNPSFVLSVAANPVVEKPLKAADMTFDES